MTWPIVSAQEGLRPFNRPPCGAVKSKMQLSSSPDKHPHNISPFNSKPPTLPMLSLFYSFGLHLSFSFALDKCALLCSPFSPCTLNITKCLPPGFVTTNVGIRKWKKHKGIKSITILPPPMHTQPPPLGADLACKLLHHLRDAEVIVWKNGDHLDVCCLCFMVKRHVDWTVEPKAQSCVS